MSFKNLHLAAGVTALATLLSGCGIMAGGSSLYQGLRPPAQTVDPAPVIAPAPPVAEPAPEPIPAPVAKPQGSVYFDVNQSVVNAAGDVVIAAWAAYLSGTSTSIEVSANADERGSAAYNKALADRRASAVVASLIAKGVAPGRIKIVNHGAEKPLVTGHDESAWAQNRRVDIVEL